MLVSPWVVRLFCYGLTPRPGTATFDRADGGLPPVGKDSGQGNPFMQMLAPDILAEARELPLSYMIVTLGIGLVLWLWGSWGWRFWLVLVTTLLAGIAGLKYGPAFDIQPLVAGLLVAIALGALALALMRILVFVASGCAGWWLAQSLTLNPQEQIACFLAGGVLGVIFFRQWIAMLTSLAGTLLIAYASLCIASRFGWIDVVAFTTQHAPLLNWGCAAGTVLGVLVQFLLQQGGARIGKKESRSRKAA